MPEYRPCFVIEYVDKKVPSTDLNHLISAERHAIEHRALFHGWSEKFENVPNNLWGTYVGKNYKQ